MRQPTKNRDERGAVFVFSVMILGFLMILASFVVDLGVDRIVRTDMQTLADTTAMDMSTILDGTKTTAQIQASAEYATTKAATLGRNAGSTAVTVNPSDVDITFGIADQSGKWIRDAGPDEYPNAVEVGASGSSSIRLWPGSDPAKPRRTARAARAPKSACVTVGSYLAALDTSPGGAPLAKLLNEVAPTNATIFSAAGLVALKELSVPLADLVTELNVADPSNPLAADVKLADLARAAARVLSKAGATASSSAIVELNQIASLSADAGINETIKLSELIRLGVGNSAAVLTGDINVFDLVTGPVFAFDGQHVIDLPSLGVAVPGFVVSNLKATVVGPPQTVCGGSGSEVSGSQVSLTATLTLSVPAYKKCTGSFLEITLCSLVNTLTGILTSLLGGSWAADGNKVLSFNLVLGGVNATAKIYAISSCEPSPDVDVSATTSLTTGSVTLTALNLLQATVNVPQTLAATSTHKFTKSPEAWTHVGGIGTNLIGPISLAAILGNSATSSAISNAIIVNSGSVNLGAQLTTALNTGLSGLGLSLNGANVSLSKMGKCNAFGLRK